MHFGKPLVLDSLASRRVPAQVDDLARLAGDPAADQALQVPFGITSFLGSQESQLILKCQTILRDPDIEEPTIDRARFSSACSLRRQP